VKKRICITSLIATLVLTLIIALSSATGLNASAKGTPSSSGTSVAKKTFKNACGKAPKGYAHCLSLVSTTTIKAPSHETTNTALRPFAAGAPGQSAPYSPAALHAAYNLPNTTAGTQTVAIVDAYDDPNAESDLAVYRSNFGLPACTTSNGCFRKVDQGGGTNYPAANSGWAGEISLDVDMVSAICNNCHLLLVEANSANFSDLGAGVNTAVSLGANEVSNSYGGGEANGVASTCNSYYEHPNVAITASTGDGGPEVESPADCSGVVAVGGTTLNSDGSETPWSGAGGGCSSFISIPSWEKSGVSGCGNRAVADVSAVADPNTGVSVYNTYQANGWYQYGGTSASSPIIAATYALAGGVSGEAPSVPWSNYTKGCLSAINGRTYNYQTGLGTPNGTGCFGGGSGSGNGTYYSIQNRTSGKVLDDPGWSTSNGTQMEQWDRGNGQANQQWSLLPASGGYYYIQNRYSGKVLDDTGWSTANGTTMEQWDLGNGQSNQEWSLVPTGGGYYYIQNRNSGKVLDDTGWSTSNGTTMEQWDPGNGQSNQEWQLIGV